MKHLSLFLCLVFSFVFTPISGQGITLGPDIGIHSLPADTDSICPIPFYLGDFDTIGIPVGNPIPAFTLFDYAGDSVNVRDLLQQGKPLLIVNGSYTCPVFRGKTSIINQVAATYGSALNVMVVYTVEAHPVTDDSPYFGFPNPGYQNTNAGILFRQPVTYGERRDMVWELQDSLPMNVPVYLDGPCNNWWLNFGTAPNNAYLVDSTGAVAAYHGWFDKYPEDIFCDIDQLLGTTSGLCGGAATGDFEFLLDGDSVHYGVPGDIIHGYGKLINHTTQPVNVLMMRLQENIPADWSSSMCVDVCYPPSVDSTILQIDPGDTLTYTMYFYTSAIPNTGDIRMGWRNESNTQNRYRQWFRAITDSSLVGIKMINEPFGRIRTYPNPATDHFYIFPEVEWVPAGTLFDLEIRDLNGTLIHRQDLFNHQSCPLSLEKFPNGVLFWQIRHEGSLLKNGKITHFR